MVPSIIPKMASKIASGAAARPQVSGAAIVGNSEISWGVLEWRMRVEGFIGKRGHEVILALVKPILRSPICVTFSASPHRQSRDLTEKQVNLVTAIWEPQGFKTPQNNLQAHKLHSFRSQSPTPQ
jgi:hypothetical protein